jgi:predicted enzyme related to lactoylglutathione lyase
MPTLLGVLETVLYVEAFERACPFYEQVLGPQQHLPRSAAVRL